MKNIAILGSTGSIGENTLAIVRAHPGRFRIKALAAKKNVQRLWEQALEFQPEAVCLYEEKPAFELSQKLKGSGIRVLSGDEGLAELSTLASVEQVIFALVGAIGLGAILQALKAGKSVAVANKEPLVIAGRLLMEESRRHKAPLLPIDSEHSGLWQCLEGASTNFVKKLILTSSGGPFRKWEGPLSEVTSEQALKHPKWKMGPKISIDSATLMNKGLEVIEAANLFGVGAEKIEVLIHPEAVIHAMVEFVDGSCLAQMGITDMRLPIQYALTYPERLDSLPSLDFAKIASLNFEKPDMERFPCLALGYEAARRGGTLPAVLNAANEIAVEAFLSGGISFTDIPETIEKTMSAHRVIEEPTLQDLLESDAWAREKARGAKCIF